MNRRSRSGSHWTRTGWARSSDRRCWRLTAPWAGSTLERGRHERAVGQGGLGDGLADAAARELAEETGLTGLTVHLEQLATYGRPGRDPRGRVVAVAHLALVPNADTPTAGSDASDARWYQAMPLLQGRNRLAFDHRRILADGIERARAKLEYSPLAAAFCPPPFTIGELRLVYEAAWGTTLDPRNFHRKVTSTPGFVEPTGATTTRQGGRPAQLYRRGTATALHPAMLRPPETARSSP